MYDQKSEPKEFVADSREEAEEKAKRFFGVGVEDLTMAVLGVTEVSGLASRVVVVAAPRNAARPVRSDRGGDEYESRRGGRGSDARERGPARGDSRDSRRGPSGRGDSREGRRGPSRGDDRERRPDAPESAPRTRELAPIASEGKALTPLGPTGEYIKGVLERMGLGSFSISEGEEGDFQLISIEGQAASELAGGDGRARDALQLLAGQAALSGGPDARRVVLDVEGDRERREDQLADLAGRAARRATQAGRAVALDPMSAPDRRAIHVALRDEPGIATMSIGSGRYRQVVVVPEGAPEYEEARRQAELASRSS